MNAYDLLKEKYGSLENAIALELTVPPGAIRCVNRIGNFGFVATLYKRFDAFVLQNDGTLKRLVNHNRNATSYSHFTSYAGAYNRAKAASQYCQQKHDKEQPIISKLERIGIKQFEVKDDQVCLSFQDFNKLVCYKRKVA